MWLPNDAKYSSKFKYVEFGHYVPSIDRVTRVMLKRHVPKIFEVSEIESLREEYNNLGLYTSVFNYDNTNINDTNRLGSLYFDVDSDDFSLATADAIKLVEYLYSHMHNYAVRIYFKIDKPKTFVVF